MSVLLKLSKYFSETTVISASAGQSFFRLSFMEFLIENDAESAHIVTKSIRHITVIDTTIVFTLLLICRNVKLFRFL